MDWNILCIGFGFYTVVLLLFYRFTKTANRNLIFLLLGLLLIDLIVTMFPGFIDGLNFNWEGKIFSILWCTLFICFIPSSLLTKGESGFVWKVKRSSWIPFFILCIIGIVIQVITEDIDSLEFDTETFLFQATMPGLSEEFVYRGIILGLLNKVFVSRTKILGASVGWGLLIQAVFFGGGHSFYFDEASQLQFALAPAIITGIIGLAIGWLREKSGSIILPIIFHNFFNLSPTIFALILKIF